MGETYLGWFEDWLIQGEHAEIAVEHSVGVPTPNVQIAIGVKHATGLVRAAQNNDVVRADSLDLFWVRAVVG